MSGTFTIEKWLKKRISHESSIKVVGGVGLVLVGSVLLYLTFWLVYGAVFLGFEWIIPMTHSVRWWIAMAVMGVVAYSGYSIHREYWSEFDPTWSTRNDPATYYYIYGWFVSSKDPYQIKRTKNLSKVLIDMMLMGPRSFMNAYIFFRTAYYLKKIDVSECSLILSFLREHDSKVSYADISERFNSIDFVKTFNALHMIDGVMFLKSDPPGIVLNDSIREEIANLESDCVLL